MVRDEEKPAKPLRPSSQNSLKPLTAEKAGWIAKKLLEFDAINRHRQLTDELMKEGVDELQMNQFIFLCVEIPRHLSNDIYNMIRAVSRDVTTPGDKLVTMTPQRINRIVEKTMARFKEKEAPAFKDW